MVWPIRRKPVGGGGRAGRERFPTQPPVRKLGHRIKFVAVTDLSHTPHTLHRVVTTRLLRPHQTPTALLAILPRQLPRFHAMTRRILTKPSH